MLNKEFVQTWIDSRSMDLRVGVCISFFGSLGSLFLIILGGSLIDSAAAKIAVTAYVGLLTLFTFIWNDSAIKEIGVSTGDMEKDVAESNVGKNFSSSPWVFYRGFAAFISFGIGITQLIALHS